ncbi:DCL protein [Zea mays]|uniref:DCL protein n=1 Tax=Zea mays TaxID=4577 RepID=A0A1D6L4J9_MAIZE|nr:DCL protein [Zea mays]
MAAGLSFPRAGAPFILLRTSCFSPWAALVPRRRLLSGPPTAGDPPPPALPPTSKLAAPPVVGTPEPPLPFRAVEAEILRDIDPVVLLIKDILHSDRYGDGECLCPRDENVVVEKLLSYHPRAQDKIGCGLDAIMIQRSSRNNTTIMGSYGLIGTLSSESQDASSLFEQTVFGLISHTRSASVHTSGKSTRLMPTDLYENISSEHEANPKVI